MKHALALSVLAVAASATTNARAEPTPEDRSLATELFLRARELLEQGHVLEACEKLEASERLDPSGGTALNLAACHERLGRTATAWSEYREALSMAKRDRREDRVRFASEHLADLEPRLSRLAVIVDAEVEGLVVVRDGTPLPRAAWGDPTPIDPGDHVIEASAPRHVPFRIEQHVLPNTGRVDVHVPALVLAEAPSPAAPAPPRRISTLTYAFGLGAVAASTVGTVAGLHAIALHRSSNEACIPTCTSEAIALDDRGKTSADVSTAAFTVAIVAAGLAVYTWIAHPTTIKE